jgi:hypothetical protein
VIAAIEALRRTKPVFLCDELRKRPQLLAAEAAGEDALRTAAGTAALRGEEFWLWKTLSIGGG